MILHFDTLESVIEEASKITSEAKPTVSFDEFTRKIGELVLAHRDRLLHEGDDETPHRREGT